MANNKQQQKKFNRTLVSEKIIRDSNADTNFIVPDVSGNALIKKKYALYHCYMGKMVFMVS